MTRRDDRAATRGMLAVLALVALTAMLAGAPPADARKTPKAARPISVAYHWEGVPEGDRVIEVYGFNGNIHATHSESESLFVDAVKRGRKDDPDDVVISTEATPTGIRVCARYPKPSGDMNDCGPDQTAENNDVIVDFTLLVPPGARLVAHTVNGSIGGEDMQGPVDAATVNGGINVVSTHRVSAVTVNGSIDVMMGPLGWTDSMSYASTNGSVLLRLPRETNAAIDARTVSGRIYCSLPLAGTEQQSAQRLIGTLGKGGPRIRLETVKGNVEIMAL